MPFHSLQPLNRNPTPGRSGVGEHRLLVALEMSVAMSVAAITRPKPAPAGPVTGASRLVKNCRSYALP